MINNLNGFSLPKDLTPAQRAGLKLWSHFVLIAVFNAILAASAYIDSLNGRPVNWQFLFIVIASQAVLAVGDATKKYFSAHGDMPLSVVIGLAQNEVATHAPEVKYSQNEQALKQSVEAALLPQDAAGVKTPPVLPSVIPAPANDPTPPNAA